MVFQPLPDGGEDQFPPDHDYRTWKRKTDHSDTEEEFELEFNRPRGMLTEDDRRFLFEVMGSFPSNRDENARKKKRTDIRSRARNGILDFRLLDDLLDDEWRDAILNPAPNALESKEEMRVGLISLLTFVYDGISQDEFEKLLHVAIDRAEQRRGRRVDITFEVDRKAPVDLDAAKAKLAEGGNLSNRELGALVRAGELVTESNEFTDSKNGETE